MQIYADVTCACRCRRSARSRARRSARRSTPPSPPAPTPTSTAAAGAMGRVRPRRLRARRGARRRATTSCTPSTATLHDYFGRGGNDVMHRLRRDPPRGARQARPHDAAPTSPTRSRGCAARSPRCTPSSSATASSSGRRATSRPASPAQDLLVIKPQRGAYDELTPDNMVVCDLDGDGRRGRPSRRRQRHRRARLRLPAPCPRSAASCTPTPRTPRAWAARGEADPVRADGDGRRVRRRDPGRPVRADRRRRHRPAASSRRCAGTARRPC